MVIIWNKLMNYYGVFLFGFLHCTLSIIVSYNGEDNILCGNISNPCKTSDFGYQHCDQSLCEIILMPNAHTNPYDCVSSNTNITKAFVMRSFSPVSVAEPSCTSNFSFEFENTLTNISNIVIKKSTSKKPCIWAIGSNVNLTNV